VRNGEGAQFKLLLFCGGGDDFVHLFVTNRSFICHTGGGVLFTIMKVTKAVRGGGSAALSRPVSSWSVL
jgi:hypothetical protein